MALAVFVGIAIVRRRKRLFPRSIGALICAATILVVMIVICRQWVKALQVYLNYDQYEDTYLERPSTKPQGIAHVISSATSFTKKGAPDSCSAAFACFAAALPPERAAAPEPRGLLPAPLPFALSAAQSLHDNN